MFRSLALCTALAVAPPALADMRVSYAEEGRTLFSFAVPEFWSVGSGGARDITAPGEDIARSTPQIITLTPSVDPTVWMGFFSPDGVGTIDEGVRYLSEIEKFFAQNATISSRSAGRVAGRPAQIIRGTGRRDGQDLGFTISVLDLPGARVAIAAAVAATTTDPEFLDEINAIFASVRTGQ